jgi:hypothetical protein
MRGRPPRAAMWIIGLVAGNDGEVLVGDLVEEYTLNEFSDTDYRGRYWSWSQVCRSIPPLLRARSRRERWTQMATAAVGSLLVVAALVAVSDIAAARLFSARPAAQALSSFAAFLLALLAGGYLAACMRPGAVTLLAAMTALLSAVSMATMKHTPPLWFQLTQIVTSGLFSLAGGWIRVRTMAAVHASKGSGTY